MKGLLLAGGHGTRLRPLTFTGNKHMIPIANQPMLYYGLHHLREAGVRDVAIVLGPIQEGIRDKVGDGRSFDLRVTYVEQPEPRGIAHAILCARDFLKEDPFLLYLGDNLLEEGARPFVDRFEQGDAAGVIGVSAVPEPSHYGVAEMSPEGEIRSIEEKPAEPKSNLAVIGVYLFGPQIHSVVESLTPSGRGELEITDAIWKLQKATGAVRVVSLKGWWKDTGRPEDLLEANERVLSSRRKDRFTVHGDVHPGATVSGPVELGVGSSVADRCVLRGPVALGRNVRIEDGAYIGPYTSIGDGSIVRRAEVDRSILMEDVVIDTPRRIVDSIVGRGSQVRSRDRHPSGESFMIGDASKVLQ